MKKYSLLLLLLAFTGCSKMTFNASMCDKVSTEPGATMPKECVEYTEEGAQKALDKPKTKLESKEDVIEFTKDND